jgi:hypothetical protein
MYTILTCFYEQMQIKFSKTPVHVAAAQLPFLKKLKADFQYLIILDVRKLNPTIHC